MVIPRKAVMLLIFIISAHSQTQTSSAGFPQLLWTFWDGDLTNPNTQILLKLCLNNMQEYASSSGWQFNLVTYDNLQKYLSKQTYEECLRLLKQIDWEFKQMRADIIRLELLKDNGGMWVDSSTFFVDRLDWINNIANEKLPMLNRITDHPDLLTFRLDDYDMPDGWVHDNVLNQSVHLSPGLENWAIIAKKETPFIRDSIKIIEQIIYDKQRALEKKIEDNQVKFSQYALNSYFRFGIYTFQLVMQFKQRELDLQHQRQESTALLNVPKYAVEYYKLWTISSTDMGFNLEEITDKVLPFFPFVFLASPSTLVESYNINLQGFVKMGGIKRKYIETILETIIDPTMCWVVFADTYKLTNDSYFYQLMIQNNQEPTGVALKQYIQDMEADKQKRQKMCQLSTNNPELEYFLEWVKLLVIYVAAYTAVLFILFIAWVKCHSLLRINHKAILVFLLIVGSIYTGLFYHNKSTKEACSYFEPGPDHVQLQKTKAYFREMKSQLPTDNSSMFQMFFREHILKLTDDFSQFIVGNSVSYVGFFWKYILGFVLLFSLLLLRNKIGESKRIVEMTTQENSVKRLTVFRLGLLVIIVLLSFWVLGTSYSMNNRVKQSLCYLTEIPDYFTNERALRKSETLISSNQGMKIVQPGRTSSMQSDRLNWIEFVDHFHQAFEKIFMMVSALKGSFMQQSEEYVSQLTDIRESLDPSVENQQQLGALLTNKIALISDFKSDLKEIESDLVCENRVIEALKFINDNLFNLVSKLTFFLDNFLPLETIAFLGTGVLLAMSVIFCLCTSILCFRGFKSYASSGQGPRSYRKEKMTFALLACIAFTFSLTSKTVVLSSYYFCDFVDSFRVSLENSSDFFTNLFDEQCMASAISDSLLKRLEVNYQLRSKPFQNFLGLSTKMDPIASYPFDQERLLIEAGGLGSSDFNKFSQDYNNILQLYSQKYGENRVQLQAVMQKQFSIYPTRIIDEAEAMIYQPVCVFKFNALYQLTSYFLGLGYLSLLAFFASLLLEYQALRANKENSDESTNENSESQISTSQTKGFMEKISSKESSQMDDNIE